LAETNSKKPPGTIEDIVSLYKEFLKGSGFDLWAIKNSLFLCKPINISIGTSFKKFGFYNICEF